MSISFHTSLVVTRPVLSEGVKASPLRVRLFGIRGLVAVTLGWSSFLGCLWDETREPPQVGPPSVRF